MLWTLLVRTYADGMLQSDHYTEIVPRFRVKWESLILARAAVDGSEEYIKGLFY